jgi:hypothetical protein
MLTPPKLRLFPVLILGLGLACQPQTQSETNYELPVVATSEVSVAGPELDPYWTQGKAEVSSYDLQQSRYGEVRQGHAVLIFVTEDFLTDKQVKNESYQSQNSTKVLKTNHLRKFTTGIYDYALMTSVFNPVNTRQYPHALKITFSSQDWCGQSYMQLNQRGKGYEVELRSYFEQEGDRNYQIGERVLLEDELFNLIRLDPDGLPEGAGKMLPSMTYARLKHRDYQPMQVNFQKQMYKGSDFPGEELMVYRVDFPTLNRQLEIIYEANAPYRIAGWKDRYPDGPQAQSTIAKRKKSLMTPYWSQNDLADQPLREELGLP